MVSNWSGRARSPAVAAPPQQTRRERPGAPGGGRGGMGKWFLNGGCEDRMSHLAKLTPRMEALPQAEALPQRRQCPAAHAPRLPQISLFRMEALPHPPQVGGIAPPPRRPSPRRRLWRKIPGPGISPPSARRSTSCGTRRTHPSQKIISMGR